MGGSSEPTKPPLGTGLIPYQAMLTLPYTLHEGIQVTVQPV